MANAGPVKTALVQLRRCEPDTDKVMHQHFQPVSPAIGEQVGAVRLRRERPAAALPAFVALKATADVAVTIELPFGEQVMTLKWPASDPEGCARSVRELLQ